MTELRLIENHVDWREVDGELIALERTEAVYLAGNPTATLLWRELAHGTTDVALSELLVETYGIPEETASADVARFVEALSSRGLLEAA
jgi:Coenzyme PQQ synthesis protein D (PqqD)